MQRPSTRLCRRWYCWGSAGFARLTASAIASAFQYEKNAIAPEKTSAMMAAIGPALNRTPKAAPTSDSSTMKQKISSALRRLLDLISSNISASG